MNNIFPDHIDESFTFKELRSILHNARDGYVKLQLKKEEAELRCDILESENKLLKSQLKRVSGLENLKRKIIRVVKFLSYPVTDRPGGDADMK